MLTRNALPKAGVSVEGPTLMIISCFNTQILLGSLTRTSTGATQLFFLRLLPYLCNQLQLHLCLKTRTLDQKPICRNLHGSMTTPLVPPRRIPRSHYSQYHQVTPYWNPPLFFMPFFFFFSVFIFPPSL